MPYYTLYTYTNANKSNKRLFSTTATQSIANDIKRSSCNMASFGKRHEFFKMVKNKSQNVS